MTVSPIKSESTAEITLAEVQALRAEVAEIKTTISSLLAELAPYVEQLSPMIEEIQNSPMFRVLTGAKKKR